MKGPPRPQDMHPQRPDDASTQLEQERRLDHYKSKRDQQLWTAVMGIGMMFAGAIYWPIAVGGALMTLYAIVQYIRWSRRMTATYDPWKDPELDAWEEEHFGGS